ncbi:MAG TPA: hypothetical protein VMD91_00195 [Candidatus Sulfotelmatobacter sp.]|nr:hypothetical protein [Candidatus Sulfotelmatobacter sp.]
MIVVELDRQHAVRDRAKLGQRAAQPARGVAAVRRVRQPLRGGGVAVRVLQRRGRRIAPFEHVVERHSVRGPPQQPRRIAAVAPLVADHRPRPHDEVEAQFLAQPQHLAQVAARIGVAVEVERAVGRLVPVPRHVQVERVRAERAQRQHRRAPRRDRQALVEERAAEEEERPAVDLQLRRTVALDQHRVVELRLRGRGRRAARQQGEHERDGTPQARPIGHANAFAVP